MRYFWKGDGFYTRDGQPMDKPFAGKVCMPSVVSDIPEYRSPIDGKVISSRSTRRDDLKRSGCVEYEPSLSPLKGKKVFKNKHFAAKRGLEVDREYK
jgi:hypothetical protein